jgi:hypothetical protein
MANGTLPPLKLLTEIQAAEFLSIKPQTLTNWRCTKRVPLPFIKIGRAIRYRHDDLERFLQQNTVGTAAVA